MFQNQKKSSPEGAKKERLFRLFSAFYAIVGQSNTPQILRFADLEPYGLGSVKELKSLHVYMFTFENSFVVGGAKSGGDGDIGYSCTRPNSIQCI